MAKYLPPRPKGRTIVVGAGKGAAQMAAALERIWDGPLDGVVVTRYGYGAPAQRIEVIEAGHPVPDASGLQAARRMVAAVSGLTEDDLVIALICGGGSSLLPSPAGDLTLNDEIAVNTSLLRSGAPIAAMNAIRKHISTIKGGGLAASAHPAKLVSFIASDIPGDCLSLVASGPTLADDTTPADALAFIEQYQIDLPGSVMKHLRSERAVSFRRNDRRFLGNEAYLIASASGSLEAAAAEAEGRGISAIILSDSMQGEARIVGSVHAAITREIALRNRPFSKPVLLLSGGETTVSMRGHGKGGRNSEFALSLAIELDGVSSVTALIADTDGIDGSEDNAGAFADDTTVRRMLDAGLDPSACLLRNDSWTAFDRVNDLFVVGPTGVNVNDFRAILIE
jgi:glycerate 2-kinase